jgi:hypothetical protein
MKNTILLQKLYASQKNGIHLLELIEQIKEEMKIESLPEATTKKQYNAIKKFLNQKVLERRPILQLTHIENGYQVFTDSYMLFRFYNDEIIKQLPHTTDENNNGKCGNYPQTEKLCGIFKEGVKSDVFTVADLKRIIKTVEKNDYKKKPFNIELTKETKTRLDGVKLEKLFSIMNMKNDSKFTFLYYPTLGHTIRPIGIMHQDKEALILPMSP